MSKLAALEIEKWLRERDEEKLEELWFWADRVRRESVGNEVHFRGLVEISNYCSRDCWYCGLRGERKAISRYRMQDEEILSCALAIQAFGYGTVVLQAGEDPGLKPERIARLVGQIKLQTRLAVTLSLGEQAPATFESWRKAGAERYLLKIETTDQELLAKIHPGEPYGSRLSNLQRLRSLGYEVGSGVMVGIPGQTPAMLAKDLEWFREMDLDMIGIGPYIPHPETPLASTSTDTPADQVPNDELTTDKAVALSRILCPESNIPATTALATLNRTNGREMALSRGANVVMPNVTPTHYRQLYEIYPGKACVNDTAEACQTCLTDRVIALGRKIGKGPGGRKHKTKDIS